MEQKKKKLTEEHKRKISIGTSKAAKESGGFSLEHKRKIGIGVSKATKGKTRNPRPLDVRNKISAANKKRPKRCGKDAYNWRGGLTPTIKLIRKLDEMKMWRLSIFNRDNFTCCCCGQVGGDLHSHHIKRFIDIIKEHDIKDLDGALMCNDLWDVNNGVTLCKQCHSDEHRFFSIK